MPKLPSSVNVPPQSSGRDPGVQAPSAAFRSPLQTIAEGGAAAAEGVAKVKYAQEVRQDTINRATAMNLFRENTDAELRRIQAEKDLADPNVLSDFGSFMSEQQDKLVEQYGGSPESRAQLYDRLGQLNGEYTGQAAGISSSIARDKVKTMFDNQMKPLMVKAGADPSLENLNKQFLAFDQVMEDTKGAYNPAEENKFRQAGREQITLAALDPLLVRGQVETADALLNEGGMYQYLSADSLRNVQNRMNTIRYTRDQTDSKLSEHDKIRRNLMDRGYSKDLAFDISAGNVKVYGPDQSGSYFKINTVTGEKTPIEGPDKDVLSNDTKVAAIMQKYPKISMTTAQDMVAAGVDTGDQGAGQPGGQAGTQTTDQGPRLGQTPIEQSVEVGVGPLNIAKEKIANLVGPFWKGALYKDTTNARQALKIFNQQAKSAFAANPKFPVAEQQMILNMLPHEDKFFKDPDTAKNDMGVLRNALVDMKNLKSVEIGKTSTTARMKADLRDQVTTIDQVLSLMGPAPEKPKELSTQEEVDKLKAGDHFIWGGKEYIKK